MALSNQSPVSVESNNKHTTSGTRAVHCSTLPVSIYLAEFQLWKGPLEFCVCVV